MAKRQQPKKKNNKKVVKKKSTKPSTQQSVKLPAIQDKISLVIPCYNEEARLNIMVNALRNFAGKWTAPYEVIVVDDGSTDNTAALAKEKLEGNLKGAYNVEIIALDKNIGKGGALKAGVAKATGDYILTLDADMATSPLELAKWVKYLPDYKLSEDRILIGSREHKDSKVEGRTGRRVAGVIYNVFTQMFTSLDQADTQCGFKLYPAAVAKELFGGLKENGWAHDVELLYKADLKEVKIQTMPVSWKHVDDTKINLVKDGANMFLKTMLIGLRTKFEWFITEPIKSFGKKVAGVESSIYRLLFATLTVLLLFLMPKLSFDYGITGDEHVQKEYGTRVLSYFSTDGEFKDYEALTYRNLKYYGGLFDYITARLNPNVKKRVKLQRQLAELTGKRKQLKIENVNQNVADYSDIYKKLERIELNGKPQAFTINPSLQPLDIQRIVGNINALNITTALQPCADNANKNCTLEIQNLNYAAVDIYERRHLINSIIGFLLIFFTGLVAKEVSGSWKVAFLTLVFMALSPRIFGHSMNNPKDIPFAAASMFTILYLFRFVKQLPRPSAKTVIMLIIGIAAAINIRVGGLLLVGFLGLFTAAAYLWDNELRKNLLNISQLLRTAAIVLLIAILGFLGGTLYWPFATLSPVSNSLEALGEMSAFATAIQMVFEGRKMWSDELPWYYIPQWMIMTAPIVVLLGTVLFGIALTKIRGKRLLLLLLTLFAGVFPPAYAVLQGSSLYDGMRHFLFVYPLLVVVAAYGWGKLGDVIKVKQADMISNVVVAALCVLPLLWMVKNYPYHTAYFNEAFGGTKAAHAKYETDYWMIAVKEAVEWSVENIPEIKNGEKVGILMPDNVEAGKHYVSKLAPTANVIWARYNQRNDRSDWKYMITFSRFRDPEHIKSGAWAPGEIIHEIKVDGVTIGAVTRNNEQLGAAGKTALKSNDIRGAIELLKQEVAKNPKNELAWIDLANAYNSINNLDSMFIAAQGALALSQTEVTTLSTLGNYYYRSGDYDQALSTFQKVADLNYKFTNAYYYKALCYSNKQQPAEAIKEIELYAINDGRIPQAYDIGLQLTQNDQVKNLYFQAKKALAQNDSQKSFNLTNQAYNLNPNYEPLKEFKEFWDKELAKQQ